MINKFLSFTIAIICATAGLLAQTPVEQVIVKYEDTEGARNFIAQGLKMKLARNLLNNTPVAPISSDVDELYVLKMQNASPNTRLSFVSDLKEALKPYEYYEVQDTKNGEVEIYVLCSGQDKVEELVIYNPGIFSLNSLHGDFTVDELLEISSIGEPSE